MRRRSPGPAAAIGGSADAPAEHGVQPSHPVARTMRVGGIDHPAGRVEPDLVLIGARRLSARPRPSRRGLPRVPLIDRGVLRGSGAIASRPVKTSKGESSSPGCATWGESPPRAPAPCGTSCSGGKMPAAPGAPTGTRGRKPLRHRSATRPKERVPLIPTTNTRPRGSPLSCAGDLGPQGERLGCRWVGRLGVAPHAHRRGCRDMRGRGVNRRETVQGPVEADPQSRARAVEQVSPRRPRRHGRTARPARRPLCVGAVRHGPI